MILWHGIQLSVVPLAVISFSPRVRIKFCMFLVNFSLSSFHILITSFWAYMVILSLNSIRLRLCHRMNSFTVRINCCIATRRLHILIGCRHKQHKKLIMSILTHLMRASSELQTTSPVFFIDIRLGVIKGVNLSLLGSRLLFPQKMMLLELVVHCC